MTPQEFKDSTRYKKIKDYTEEELTAAIEYAVKHCTEGVGGNRLYRVDFYTILNGVDAYFEKRKRKELQELAAAVGQPQQPQHANTRLPGTIGKRK